jgi:hypothetical protein
MQESARWNECWRTQVDDEDSKEVCWRQKVVAASRQLHLRLSDLSQHCDSDGELESTTLM